MRYLLDTHTALWALENKTKLSANAAAIIGDVTVSLALSVASAWEVAIKVSMEKLDFEGGVAAFLRKMKDNGVAILNIEERHVEAVENLPYIHRDPFDRVLIATALADGMTIITADANIKKYDVNWVY
ncbi:MAG: type II toxin-antitoxin system VapC family toxin [Gracilibacteraceae bacterium]|jgi:PIN domain nuclease of toxin-antitoxin system|nr:type II toxin-antitoxin system VapC family toxin [Gracilibacteraceae bacterium]